MPFTPTHIAAAVPIRWLFGSAVPFSALAIGCMTPDLGVFYPELFNYEALHSLTGLLTHCVPAGLAAYYVFHIVLKEPLVELLPARFAVPLRPIVRRELDLTFKAIAIVALCMLVGSASHVFWDTFTHHSRWGVRTFPWLRDRAFEWGQVRSHWYRVFQHGSTLVFLPPMVWWAYHILTRLSEPSEVADRIADTVGADELSDATEASEGEELGRALSTEPGVPFHVFGWVVTSLCVLGVMFFVFGRVAHPNWHLEAVTRLSIQYTGAVATALALVYCLVWQWLALDRETKAGRLETSNES